MTFFDVDLFGVYVSPIVPIAAVVALLLLPVLRWADRSGLTRRVWHPALFKLAIYIGALSAVVIARGMH